MNLTTFLRSEVASAVRRGVRQCVCIGSRSGSRDWLKDTPDDVGLQVFAVGEEPVADAEEHFIATDFSSEALAAALGNSEFNAANPSLFLWLGGAGYRTVDAVLASLAFIASLPKGSGVVFDYAVERTLSHPAGQTALDALASRIAIAGNTVKHLIKPQAVAIMLKSLGFQQIEDLSQDQLQFGGAHVVSAVV